jgi:hypothetical protein
LREKWDNLSEDWGFFEGGQGFCCINKIIYGEKSLNNKMEVEEKVFEQK